MTISSKVYVSGFGGGTGHWSGDAYRTTLCGKRSQGLHTSPDIARMCKTCAKAMARMVAAAHTEALRHNETLICAAIETGDERVTNQAKMDAAHAEAIELDESNGHGGMGNVPAAETHPYHRGEVDEIMYAIDNPPTVAELIAEHPDTRQVDDLGRLVQETASGHLISLPAPLADSTVVNDEHQTVTELVRHAFAPEREMAHAEALAEHENRECPPVCQHGKREDENCDRVPCVPAEPVDTYSCGRRWHTASGRRWTPHTCDVRVSNPSAIDVHHEGPCYDSMHRVWDAVESARHPDVPTAREVGTCGVCDQLVEVKSHVLIDHGWEGRGVLPRGTCPGSGSLPKRTAPDVPTDLTPGQVWRRNDGTRTVRLIRPFPMRGDGVWDAQVLACTEESGHSIYIQDNHLRKAYVLVPDFDHQQAEERLHLLRSALAELVGRWETFTKPSQLCADELRKLLRDHDGEPRVPGCRVLTCVNAADEGCEGLCAPCWNDLHAPASGS